MWTRRGFLTVFIFAALLFLSSSVRAADEPRPLVISARYYSPPGSKAASFWHLYRLEANGSGRRQITSGAFDDSDPRWSPEGKRIAFLRRTVSNAAGREEPGDASRHASLCLIAADGSGFRVLRQYSAKGDDAPTVFLSALRPVWSPDGKTLAVHVSEKQVDLVNTTTGETRALPNTDTAQWSPDGKALLLRSDSGNRILDLTSGKETSLPGGLTGFGWRDNEIVIGVTNSDAPSHALVWVGREGKEQKRIPLTRKPESGQDADEDVPLVALAFPDDPDVIFYGANGGDSTTGRFYQFRRVLASTSDAPPTITPFADGRFLRWSPDGKRFCTVAGRDLADYGKRPDGTARSVWVQPVFVGDTKTGTAKPITTGLVHVDGADWRGDKS